jgi:subtilisin family serine protease
MKGNLSGDVRLGARVAVGLTLCAALVACGPAGVAPDAGSARRAASGPSASPLTVDSAEPVTDSRPTASGGVSRVFVRVKAPFVPEGTLDDVALQAQRLHIARAQADLLRRHAADIVHVNARYQTIPFVAVTVDDAGLEVLRRDPLVTSITADQLHRPTLAQSVPLIDAPWAWSQGASGDGVTVAVLDTGVDKDHPFLAGKVTGEACYSSTDPFLSLTPVCPGGATSSTAADSARPCSPSTSGCDHGTHVAGIVAGHDGASSGVAPNASILAIQVFSKMTGFLCYPSNACAVSTEADEVLGLERVLQLAQGGEEIGAVNMSLGGQEYDHTCDAESPATKAAIDNLRSVGIATVISSGNDGYAGRISSPACISTAISVGATNKSDHVDTSYSNSADFLSLLAPGTDIRSSVPGGGFALFSGTSMAAPHVAGAFAILKSADPDLTVSQALAALRDEGVILLDPRNLVQSSRIDVGASVNVTGVFRVSAPSFSPPAGSYVGAQTVVLSSDTPETSIRYTVDGTTPSATVGLLLPPGGAVTVPVNQTLAAIAYRADGKTSNVRYATYSLHGEAPLFAPGDGEYLVAPTVTVTAPTADTVVHYTTDGSTPTSSHGTTLASGDTVALSSPTTLRAVASRAGWSDSPVSVARYVLVGDLTVDLLPAAAADAGARWRRMDSAVDGFESGDLSRFDYTIAGDAPWSVVEDQPRYGGFALRTADLADSQQASVSASVTTDGGAITFSRKVSSEEGYDLLTFLVDGVEEGSWSGEVDWSTVTVAVRPGEHTFTWTYTKDFTGTAGLDAAWIDQITFPGDQWRASGDAVRVTAVSQRIAFSALPGWTAPSQQTVTTALGAETRATGTYVALQANAPWFDPPAGAYKSMQTLTIGSTTPGATIRYTLDGSAPNGTSPTFTAGVPLGLNSSTTVRAIAQVEGWLDSAESSGSWTVTGTAAAPVFDPPPGTFTDAVSLTMSTTTPGASIHYTLDGTPPGLTTPTYTGPIALSRDQTVEVRARAYVDTWADSPPTFGGYVVGSPISLTPNTGTASDPLPTGAISTLTVVGGLGPFTVDAAPNAAGTKVTPASVDERTFTFAAPVVGAFAGVYALTATDDTTGATSEAELVVAPTVELSATTLTALSKLSTVTVRGAKAGELVALAVVDEQGEPVTGVADLQAGVPAANAPDQGNPATSSLVLLDLDHAATVRVQATAGGVTVLSAAVSLEATVDPKDGPGCTCAERGSDRAPLAIAALAAWLVRRRRAPGGAQRRAA